jgi:hypothetical protein
MLNDIKGLRDSEVQCLKKFRSRARKLKAANPGLTREQAFAMATEQMPRTANRYSYVRGLLKQAGIAALPLFE